MKTPIFAAQGFVHLLIDGAKNDPKVRDRFLKKAAKSLDSLDVLVKDLIAISQLETGEFRLELDDFDIIQLIKDEIDQFEHKAKKKKIKLTFTSNVEQPIYVHADYYRIAQVFQNLISNGINYAGEKSTISISAIHGGDFVFFEVKDDGIGISEEHLSSIFNRFYRVDKSRSREKGGSGLGLSIVKHIVEAHDSSISAKSSLGQGVTFQFQLKIIEPINEA